MPVTTYLRQTYKDIVTFVILIFLNKKLDENAKRYMYTYNLQSYIFFNKLYLSIIVEALRDLQYNKLNEMYSIEIDKMVE